MTHGENDSESKVIASVTGEASRAFRRRIEKAAMSWARRCHGAFGGHEAKGGESEGDIKSAYFRWQRRAPKPSEAYSTAMLIFCSKHHVALSG